MTRPSDWSPLDLDSDPVPGDPERISQEAAHLSRVATTITSQIAALRKISEGGPDGTLTGQYAETIRSSATGLAEQLSKVVGRYQKAAQALSQWVPELDYAQSESVQALYKAEDAARRQLANAPVTRTPGQGQATAQQKQENQARSRALQQADSDMAAAHRQLNNAVSHRDVHGSETAATISRAIDDAVADSWWDQFRSFVDHFAVAIRIVCTVSEVIATILALVALFIPGLDVIVMLAIAATALALIGRTVLAATGNGSWTQVTMDALALLTFGAGRIIGTVAEGGSEAGETLSRLAMSGEEGSGSAGPADDLISTLADRVEDDDTAWESDAQIFRVVGPEEAADIAEVGVYRNPYGLEGKYFFPTVKQAVNLARMFTKLGLGGPYTLTSGLVAQVVLDAAEQLNAAGEGTAFFLSNEQLPLITDVTIHGMQP